MNSQATDGYWTYNEEGNLEFRDVETHEVLDEVSFEKARSLTAFMMWHLIESFGAGEEEEQA